MRLGALACGRPAHDPEFGTAGSYLLLAMADVDPRLLRHLLGGASPPSQGRTIRPVGRSVRLDSWQQDESVAVAKVSLSLDPDLVPEAREFAGRRGLSALVNDALRVRLQHLRVTRLLDDMDAEFGPVPGDVAEEVARQWPVPPPRRAAG